MAINISSTLECHNLRPSALAQAKTIASNVSLAIVVNFYDAQKCLSATRLQYAINQKIEFFLETVYLCRIFFIHIVVFEFSISISA